MDFYGFCGAKTGDAFDTGPSGASYRGSGASANTALGNYGNNIGRGRNVAPNDEYMYLSNSGWEWLSEQYNYNLARIAGGSACSYVGNYSVYSGSYRFRAVFRP